MIICEHNIPKLVGKHTTIEWLEWAKATGYPWAQDALRQNTNTFGTKKTSLSTALCTSFTWVNSREGYPYWRKIYTQLRNEKL